MARTSDLTKAMKDLSRKLGKRPAEGRPDAKGKTVKEVTEHRIPTVPVGRRH